MSKAKIAPGHQGRIKEMEKLYRKIRPNPLLKKVAFGKIASCGNSSFRVRLSVENGCVKVWLRGTTAVQEARFYSDAPVLLQEELAKLVEDFG